MNWLAIVMWISGFFVGVFFGALGEHLWGVNAKELKRREADKK